MKNLELINESNEREVDRMVGKAMCAYANWTMEVHDADTDPVAACGFRSEYEATVRCIAMFVHDPLSHVCAYVIDGAHEAFGI